MEDNLFRGFSNNVHAANINKDFVQVLNDGNPIPMISMNIGFKRIIMNQKYRNTVFLIL